MEVISNAIGEIFKKWWEVGFEDFEKKWKNNTYHLHAKMFQIHRHLKGWLIEYYIFTQWFKEKECAMDSEKVGGKMQQEWLTVVITRKDKLDFFLS